MSGKDSELTMSDKDSELTISIIDNRDYYIYNAVTLMGVLLLLWFFVRSQLNSSKCNHVDGMENIDIENTTEEADSAINILLNGGDPYKLDLPLTDRNYKNGALFKGMYGDVPVYLYDDEDIPHVKEWRKVNGGIYIPNSKKYWASI